MARSSAGAAPASAYELGGGKELDGNKLGASTVTLTDGATITPDCNDGLVWEVTLGDDRTMAAPTNPQDGMTFVLTVKQDGTGTRLITWNAVFNWPGGTSPTLTTTLTTGRDIITGVYNATDDKWNCSSLADMS